LSEVLIRNRKKAVGGFMPRHAHRWEVTLSHEERRALGAVESYVREGYARAERSTDSAVGFVMVIFQKMMASSIWALRQSLNRRRIRLENTTTSVVSHPTARLVDLEDRLDDDAFAGDVLDELAEANAEEAAELKQLVELLDEVPRDSKADTLVAELLRLEEHDPSAKVLLFTEFRETQEYLRSRIESMGWNVQLFHGQLKPDAKDAAVEAFRTAEKPSILLSTEAGGEGRNFQFCHLLVNYDLPWNPMRVEQRIGRVDRIGQTEVVQVFNFWVKGTVEERVLDVLERRINVFEDTVGGLDPILGDTERDLAKILRLGGVQREEALREFEEQIERKIVAARAAEEKLRDFIMETKSYSKEIASMVSAEMSPVSPAEQELLVRHLLADVRTYLDRQPDGTYEIMFHEPFVSDYPHHTKGELRRRSVALRPDVQPDSEHVEYFAFGHPVVDDLVARVTSPSYTGSASAFDIENEDLGAASGWLAVFELGVPSLREIRELDAYFVDDEGIIRAALGAQLVARAAQFPNDRAIDPADVPTDSLDDALAAAEAEGFRRLEELEARAHGESTALIDREQAKLTTYFDYRDEAARDRLTSSRNVLARIERAEDPETQRIIPVWRANVARDERLIEELARERVEQLARLEHRIAGGGDLKLIAVARVQINSAEDV
jgi:hypothetical protein